MSAGQPEWGVQSRFYVPNEDAAVLRASFEVLPTRPRNPVFVGGSGMILLEAVRVLPDMESAVFIDVAAFQCAYAARLFAALEEFPDPAAFRAWFEKTVYPDLHGHFLAKGTDYPLERVLNALENRFGIEFMFKDAAYNRVKASLARVRIVEKDIITYLAAPERAHDFIYLSNVPDYLPPKDAEVLFRLCRQYGAPVYLLCTSACKDQPAIALAWEKAGYRPHPESRRLDAMNRGLGCAALTISWNRPGVVYLLEL